MFSKVLIANRGAISVRIARTLREMGIASVAVYAEEDSDSLHIQAADEAFSLGSGSAADTYLDQSKLLSIIHATNAQAVHPGYGFLSENAGFARALAAEGIAFIGPQPPHLEQFGLKHEARRIAEKAAVNLLPGTGVLADLAAAQKSAKAIGYPVMLKSSAGGGGIGMQCCYNEAELGASFEAVARLARGNFGNAELFLEKYIAAPRHVEVQAFGDGKGNVAIVGDRDCSLQRRNQKVVEECPAPGLSDVVRETLHAQARALLSAVQYESAGTVEFLYDPVTEEFYFLEVNTRLQVEHGVTEMVHGVDLVEYMVRQAAGALESLSILDQRLPRGHAVQARVYAEDPRHDFRPTPGRISQVAFPNEPDVRVDTWVQNGTTVPYQFDPLLAKVLVCRPSRDEALTALEDALLDSSIAGIESNIRYLGQALGSDAMRAAQMTTATLAELSYSAPTIDVLTPGAATTVQSFPGRQGYWAVGVPPSGPMDDLSFQLGNRLLGNDSDAAGLELVLNGPRLVFNAPALVVVTGAAVALELDDVPVPMWTTIDVRAGQSLSVGSMTNGMRSYLLFKGGLDLPDELGSSATFTLGEMGGHAGRALRTGDVLTLNPLGDTALAHGSLKVSNSSPVVGLANDQRPVLNERLQLRVTLGPHVAPDYFTESDIDRFLSSDWTVHYNSSRTGVRLTGPQPQWARADGGEAGMHPSNIHDNAYAFGSIDFTGDMPVILGPDGPSLGGFVCPAVVINADRWKLGQLVPGDKIRFVATTEADAGVARELQLQYIQTLARPIDQQPEQRQSPVVYATRELTEPEALTASDVAIRRAGQEWLLVEFGAPILDVALHLKVHSLHKMILAQKTPGIVEMTPGIRSLQIRYDMDQWTSATLRDHLLPLLEQLPAEETGSIESRIVRLPLSWEDPACLEAVEKYVKGVRKDAPWCPDNVEFIRRINGLESKDDVKRIVFDASYLVMGLGDVYLGAPVATPLDPRHRLVTTKYNPARTWTAENSVGIGGSYLCIYGMEGPGGYQFVGRTLQVWNTHQRGTAFTEPWLLRPFDQLQFYPVEAAELMDMRSRFARGETCVQVEPVSFDVSEYHAFLAREEDSIAAFTKTRKAAFDTELARWQANGQLTFDSQQEPASVAQTLAVPDGAVAVASPMSGSVWALPAADAERVENDDTLIVIEAMKSEFEVRAPMAGALEILVAAGEQVQAGQTLAFLRPE
ncbi:MAG: urea carboxylase [Pseudomonadales bacterium]